MRSLLVAVSFASAAASATPIIETNWWSNQSSALNVVDPLFGAPPVTERVRLSSFTSGFIEGTVNLGLGGSWVVAFAIGNDSDPLRDTSEFTDVFINGNLLARVLNDTAGLQTELSTVVSGPHFTYRFEFSSGNANIGLHQIVQRGTATRVPAPHSIFLLAVLGWFTTGTVARSFDHRPGRRRPQEL